MATDLEDILETLNAYKLKKVSLEKFLVEIGGYNIGAWLQIFNDSQQNQQFN